MYPDIAAMAPPTVQQQDALVDQDALANDGEEDRSQRESQDDAALLVCVLLSLPPFDCMYCANISQKTMGYKPVSHGKPERAEQRELSRD